MYRFLNREGQQAGLWRNLWSFPHLPPPRAQHYVRDCRKVVRTCSHMHTYKLKCFSYLPSQHQQPFSRLLSECSPHVCSALFQQSCTASEKVTLEEETQLFLQAPLGAFLGGGEGGGVRAGRCQVRLKSAVHFPWDCVPCKDLPWLPYSLNLVRYSTI